MIETVLVVFLLLVAIVATMAIKVGVKAVDFIEATYRFYDRVEARQEKILRALQNESGSRGEEKET
jgi:hypothetical protein